MPTSPARGPTPRADPPADPRGDRFAAALTALVMLGVLLTLDEALFAAQAVVFALGAFVGPRYAPYPALYRAAVAPRLAALRRAPGLTRLGAASRPEAAVPVRGAYALGFALAVLGTLGYLTGLTGLGVIAAGLLLADGVVNAASGFSPARVAYQALYQVFTRLIHHPPHPDTQQGAIA